jgi:META domain-containing protein
MRIVSQGNKFVLAAVLVFAPLAEVHAMDVSALKGRWVLEAVDGKPIGPEKGEIYFQVTEQTITGFDGCNRFGANVAQPSPIQKGQRGCPPETILLPLDLSNPVTQLSRATVRGDKLFLPLPDGKGEAQFRRSQ